MAARTLNRTLPWQACVAALLAVLLAVFSAASVAHMHQPQQHAPADQCALCVSIAQFQATCVPVAVFLLASTWELLPVHVVADIVRPRWMPATFRIRPPPSAFPS